MSYKLYIETENCFKVWVGQFECFEDAQSHMEEMIVRLIAEVKKETNGYWDAFKNKFPNKIQKIFNSYESVGFACAQEDTFGRVDDGEYSIDECGFYADSELDEWGYGICIYTDTLGMDGSEDAYYFTLQKCVPDYSTVLRGKKWETEEDLERDRIKICLEYDPVDEEDEESGDAIVYNLPDELLAQLEPADLEDDDD